MLSISQLLATSHRSILPLKDYMDSVEHALPFFWVNQTLQNRSISKLKKQRLQKNAKNLKGRSKIVWRAGWAAGWTQAQHPCKRRVKETTARKGITPPSVCQTFVTLGCCGPGVWAPLLTSRASGRKRPTKSKYCNEKSACSQWAGTEKATKQRDSQRLKTRRETLCLCQRTAQ